MSDRRIRERHYRAVSTDTTGREHTIIVNKRYERAIKGRTVSFGSEKIAFKDGRFMKSESHSFSFNLLGLVFSLLLIFSLYSLLSGSSSEPKTFYGFLKTLQTVPNISVSFVDVSKGLNNFLGILAPVLGFLVPLIEILKPAIVVSVSLGSGVLQLLTFFTWVLRYFFM